MPVHYVCIDLYYILTMFLLFYYFTILLFHYYYLLNRNREIVKESDGERERERMKWIFDGGIHLDRIVYTDRHTDRWTKSSRRINEAKSLQW